MYVQSIVQEIKVDEIDVNFEEREFLTGWEKVGNVENYWRKFDHTMHGISRHDTLLPQ